MQLRLFFLSVSLLWIFSYCQPNLFQEKPKLIKKISVSFEGSVRNVFLYQTYSNATVNEAVFIRTGIKQAYATHIFERYDSVLSAYANDNYLTLVLQDNRGYQFRVDTINIPLNEIFKPN